MSGATGGASGRGRNPRRDQDRKPDPILFQQWFRSIGPRIYAAQIKRAGNGNQYLVLTESKRDEGTSEPRKTRIFVYGEDFGAFFSMLRELANWMKEHPLDAEFLARRKAFWSRKSDGKMPDQAATLVQRKGGAEKPRPAQRPAGAA